MIKENDKEKKKKSFVNIKLKHFLNVINNVTHKNGYTINLL